MSRILAREREDVGERGAKLTDLLWGRSGSKSEESEGDGVIIRAELIVSRL